MALKDIAQGKTDCFKIAPQEIVVDEQYNVRDPFTKDESFVELKASIAANGVRTPLTVSWKNGAPVLIAGHRRLAAVMELIAEGVEVETVPVLAVRFNEDQLLADLIVSNSGQPLTALEQGRVFARMVELGWDKKKMAESTGKSVSYVNYITRLHVQPEEVKVLVREGKVKACAALGVIKDKMTPVEKVEAVKGAILRKENGETPAPRKPAKNDVTIPVSLVEKAIAILCDSLSLTDEQLDAIEAILMKKSVK